MQLLLTTFFSALFAAHPTGAPASHAASSHPDREIATPAPTPLLRYLRVGSQRIDFDVPGKGAARFSTVARALGGKEIASEEGTATLTRCYILSGSAPHMVLAFYGDDTGNDVLTDFDLAPASRKPDLVGKCSPLAVSPRQVVTDRGVRIGLPRADVEELIGKSRRAIDGQPIYEISEKRSAKSSDGTPYSEYVSSSITVTYRNRVVVGFSGGISESE
jgi:hypothetical protein